MSHFRNLKSRFFNRRFIYLLLAAICFMAAFITYFIDGYLGVYDTLSLSIDGKTGQTVETYQWLRRNGSWVGSTVWGKTVHFSYEIGNHEFRTYSDVMEVSLWHDGKEIGQLASRPLTIAPFRAGKVDWSIDTLALDSAPPSEISHYTYSIFIEGDRIQRELIFYITAPPEKKEPAVVIRSRREVSLAAPGLSGSDMPLLPKE